ncbi:hypothetical protein B1L33_10635 [Salmonella enterica]|nr:hypothetical protein [Salmonella enterica]EAY0411074.1 hypothetical protein [Salmonella enterica]EAY0420721.1 hypothetical protein [Salmonella enterica]EBA6750179.1 hypothetical protein [Salmonella enterica]EBQ8273014.1 hypothetical protein [Salmonella enterica]
MNLDEQDAQTISSYIRASRPDYKGPVFVDLSRLEKIYMWEARLRTHLFIRKMTSNITNQCNWRGEYEHTRRPYSCRYGGRWSKA